MDGSPNTRGVSVSISMISIIMSVSGSFIAETAKSPSPVRA
jgi:hypothetical protein